MLPGGVVFAESRPSMSLRSLKKATHFSMISFDALRTRICSSALLTLSRMETFSVSHSLINKRRAEISAISVARNAARSALSPDEASAIILIFARSIEALILLILTIHAPIPLTMPDRATHIGVWSLARKVSRSNVFLVNSMNKNACAGTGGTEARPILPILASCLRFCGALALNGKGAPENHENRRPPIQVSCHQRH
jgi:hypothetical protein